MRGLLMTICLFGAASCVEARPLRQQSTSPTAHQPGAGMTAAEISGRMSKAYSNFASYEDSGNIHVAIVSEAAGETVEDWTFTTAFVRPDRFRYQFTTKNAIGDPSRYVLWQKGTDVKTWWDQHSPHSQTEQSLFDAIGAATGISNSTAQMIPRLLMPDTVFGPSLGDLPGVARLPDAEQAGSLCFVLEGTEVRWNMRKVTTRVWIDQTSLLVRRVDTESTGPDYSSKASTTYAASAGAAVAEAKLAFAPPEP